MNHPLIQTALWVSAVGSAVVGGVFFAFSTFVMTALGNLPPAQGLAAMQAINRSVLSSLFLAVFMLTAATSIVVVIAALTQRGPGALAALGGAALYVLGAFAVTAHCNVPLNESIAALDSTQAHSADQWSDYLRMWTAWNHVRTTASLLALAGFMLGLQSGASATEGQP